MPEWRLLQVTAPAIAWVASAVIVVFTAVELLWLAAVRLWKFRRLRRATKALAALRKTVRYQPDHGLDGASFDRAREQFKSIAVLRLSWSRFEAECVRIPNTVGGAGFSYWRTRPASDAFSEHSVIDSQLNRSWYAALPSVITGFGLLITFLSILLALMGLKVEANETVKGMRELIAGLSGKFVSSIVALFCATVFLLFEKPLLRSIVGTWRSLCAELDDLVPRRDSAQTLSNVELLISEQTDSFKNFGTKLAVTLKNSMNESMTESLGPQQERLIAAVEELNTLMKAAESQKQESMTGELSGLLQRLETSLSEAIKSMGSRFSESLSGGAAQQMGSAIASLGDTAALLDKMNKQFDGTQVLLSRVVEQAHDATQQQMSLGKTQIEDLTATLKNLMVQISDHAGTSVGQMSATLTAVVHDLAEKVSALGQDLSRQVATSSGEATVAAQAVIKSADQWTATSEARLGALLERMETGRDTAESFAKLLNQTLGGYREAVGTQGALITQMREVSNQLGAASTAISGGLQRLETQYSYSLQAAALSKEQVERLEGANREQVASWRALAVNMQSYADTFKVVEASAARLLETVGGRIQGLTDLTHTHFTKLEKHTDDYLGDAVKKLGGSIGELQETLEDLDEVLAKMRTMAGEKPA